MKECMIGIAIVLFSILLQMCSTGLELLTLGIGVVGLIFTIVAALKKEG